MGIILFISKKRNVFGTRWSKMLSQVKNCVQTFHIRLKSGYNITTGMYNCKVPFKFCALTFFLVSCDQMSPAKTGLIGEICTFLYTQSFEYMQEHPCQYPIQ